MTSLEGASSKRMGVNIRHGVAASIGPCHVGIVIFKVIFKNRDI
jgi:hypothetical protein